MKLEPLEAPKVGHSQEIPPEVVFDFNRMREFDIYYQEYKRRLHISEKTGIHIADITGEKVEKEETRMLLQDSNYLYSDDRIPIKLKMIKHIVNPVPSH